MGTVDVSVFDEESRRMFERECLRYRLDVSRLVVKSFVDSERRHWLKFEYRHGPEKVGVMVHIPKPPERTADWFERVVGSAMWKISQKIESRPSFMDRAMDALSVMTIYNAIYVSVGLTPFVSHDYSSEQVAEIMKGIVQSAIDDGATKEEVLEMLEGPISGPLGSIPGHAASKDDSLYS